MLKDISLKGGKITYNDFHIDLTQPLENQIWEIKEDLLQIEYPKSILLDVGFYPEFYPSGSFKIAVVKESNWEEPLLKKRIDKDNFLSALQECIDFAAKL